MNVLVRNMEAGVCEKMVKLFNIAFFVVKEEIAFAKFPSLIMISRPAQNLHSFLENCVGESNTFQGVDLRGERDAEIERFSYVKTRIIHAILRFLESRFSSFDTSAVLKAGTIFDHKTWPEDRKELATFGEENLKCLTRFRAPLEHNGCDLVAAEQEWLNMKIYVFHNLRMLQYTTLWQRMLNDYSEDYHNILMVVRVLARTELKEGGVHG